MIEIGRLFVVEDRCDNKKMAVVSMANSSQLGKHFY